MKYKVSPKAPKIVYQFCDKAVNPTKKYIEFTPTGEFFLYGKKSKDVELLGKTLIEWLLYFSEQSGFIEADKTICDCGGVKAKTTCVSWCSSNKKP